MGCDSQGIEQIESYSISKSELVANLEEEELRGAILGGLQISRTTEQDMTPSEMANSLELRTENSKYSKLQ